MPVRRHPPIKLFALCLPLLAAVAAGQSTLAVPGGYPDVQSALAAAASGDTVLVGPGVWAGPVDFLGKNVRVTSTAGADTTFLDGANATNVVRFQNGETAAAILEGFTVQNGLSELGTGGGGGIYCVDASPTVRDCVIKNCRGRDGSSATSWVGAAGGGAYVHGGGPRFIDCRFENNVGGRGSDFDPQHPTLPISGFRGGNGGGLYATSFADLRLTRCTFTANRAGDGGDGPPTGIGGAGGGGGGLLVVGSTAFVMEDCVFDGNYTGDGGDGDGGDELYGGAAGSGGGAFVSASPIAIRGCLFLGNVAGLGGNGGAGAGVGGLLMQGSDDATLERSQFIGNLGGDAVFGYGDAGGLRVVGAALITACVFRGNVGGGGGAGGATNSLLPGALPTFRNCEFTGNIGGGNGDGQYGLSPPGPGAFEGSARFLSCTIADNAPGTGSYSTAAGGLFIAHPSVVRDSVLWGNVGGAFAALQSWQVPPTVSTSCIEGGFAGFGNLDADPQFAAPSSDDYRLSAGSPCLEAGDATLTPPNGPPYAPAAFDGAGMPRFLDGDLNGVVRLDMGAYEFNHGRLAAQKSTAANGDTALTLEIDGTPGYFAFVAAGLPDNLWFPPYGPLLLTPSSLIQLLIGPLPMPTPTFVVPAGAPSFTIYVQGLVFDGGRYGTFTNRLELELP